VPGGESLAALVMRVVYQQQFVGRIQIGRWYGRSLGPQTAFLNATARAVE